VGYPIQVSTSEWVYELTRTWHLDEEQGEFWKHAFSHHERSWYWLNVQSNV